MPDDKEELARHWLEDLRDAADDGGPALDAETLASLDCGLADVAGGRAKPLAQYERYRRLRVGCEDPFDPRLSAPLTDCADAANRAEAVGESCSARTAGLRRGRCLEHSDAQSCHSGHDSVHDSVLTVY